MVIPYGEVGAFWWDAHFISLDYGFGKSSASAHLHVLAVTHGGSDAEASPAVHCAPQLACGDGDLSLLAKR